MIRYFPLLALMGAALLAADFMIGLKAALEGGGPGGSWREIHFAVSVVTVSAVLGIHTIVFTYFNATGRRVYEAVREHKLTRGFDSIARKNRTRAMRFALGGILMIVLTACMGTIAETRGGASSIEHLAIAAATIAYNLGAFLAEFAMIVAQTRLLAEIEDRVGRIEADRKHPEPAPSDSPMHPEPARPTA